MISAAAVDLKYVKANAEKVALNAQARGVSVDVPGMVDIYNEVVSLTTQVRNLRKEKNDNAALMKKAGKMSAEERQEVIQHGKQIKGVLTEAEGKLLKLEEELEEEAAKIPNLTHPDVPQGGEENATLLRTNGEQRDFEFEPKDHLELATALDIVDFENAARVVGNKFYYLRNAGALLELALVNYAMSRAAAAGFTVMTTPDVARESVVAGCGFQPRGEASQVYRLEESDLCLAGTAEILLGGYYSGQIVEKAELPVKMAAFSHCFRREVGAAGTTTRGLYRVHQFSKVELFCLTTPEKSDEMHAELTKFEEDLFSSLGLHYRVLDMPTLDLGAPAYRKIDIEAWMPGRGTYGEISSSSNCTDYQARRLGIRYREKRGDNRFVHTLNATACAVPRMIVAILENYQRDDGSVDVPEALRPFLGGLQRIEKPAAGVPAGMKEHAVTA